MFLDSLRPWALALVRIIVGYSFILHATSKFWEWPISMTGGNGAVQLGSLIGVGGVIELVFGALFILGLFTRVAAFLLSGQMAVAYLMFHAAGEGGFFLPMVNGGEPALLFSVIFLVYVFTGAGALSLDSKRLPKK